MTTLYLILFIAAFVCFLIAAFAQGRVQGRATTISFVALGLALWVLVPLIQTAHHLGK